MFWLDWIIVFVPLLIVIYIGWKSQKFVRGVSDFLAAGRCAGRYVLTVAGGEAAMGLISVVAIVERDYNAGFAFGFWNKMNVPLGMILGLTGYCVYRLRETRALTMGQFFEMRYSKSFRVFAAILQALSGVVNYALFPAVGARFLIYFLGLPPQLTIGALTLPMTGVLMVLFLGLALLIILVGGQITIMVTDCVQGLLSYPMYVIIIAYILYRFSWNSEMAPVLMDRAPGQSFIDPYDIGNLDTFNLFYVIVGIVATIINRISWSSDMGYRAAARNPHEQKMGNLLGTWRSGLSTMTYTLLSVAAITYMTHHHFQNDALKVRTQLASKVIEDVASDAKFTAARAELKAEFAAMPPAGHIVGVSPKLSGTENLEKVYFDKVNQKLKNIEGGKSVAGTFRTIYGQMLVPLALRELFPMGITGVFCALMIFLLVSTDTTYMHTWGSVILQDIIMPFRKKPFTPAQHLRYLRLCITGVAVFAFIFSLCFAQIDYILMFFDITGAIWLGGCGPVIVFGLYSRRGNTAGAYASMISGAGIAVGGFILQKTWAEHVFPWFARHGLVESWDHALRWISSNIFGDFVHWYMKPNAFPINSREIYFFAMVISIVLYMVISLLTSRRKFNMDAMLHRGKYAIPGESTYVHEKLTLRNCITKIVGITNEYTTGDKILAWSVFGYSFVYSFLIIFVMVVIWNAIQPWSIEGWKYYFLVVNFWVVGLIGAVTCVWFTIGGIADLKRLFRDLAAKKDVEEDDGRVIKTEETEE